MRLPMCQMLRGIPSSMTSNDLWRPLGIRRQGRSGWKPLLNGGNSVLPFLPWYRYTPPFASWR
jgi:hypothetical protein